MRGDKGTQNRTEDACESYRRIYGLMGKLTGHNQLTKPIRIYNMNTTTTNEADNNTPKIGSMWLGQNQRAYKVTAIANIDGAPSLTPATVVYENSTGVYTRPLRSWHGSMTAQSA